MKQTTVNTNEYNNSKLLIKTIWIQTTVHINKNNMNTNNSKLLIKTIWIQTTVSY